MPKLNPGINPHNGRGRHFVFLLASVLFSFLLQAQPIITSFTPLAGQVGTTVTITGSNFGTTPSNNIVYFGAARATVSAASSTSLTVTVPTGASYQPLTVTTGGLTAYSARPFNLTFSDPGQFLPNAFQRQDITTGTTPLSICAKDLDGDGKIDFALISNYDLFVYSNTSTPGFPQFSALPAFTPNAGSLPLAVTAGDLDGDGMPELVVSLMDGHISIFRNTSTSGNISFTTTPLVIYAGANNTGQYADIIIADCNGDGKPDIVSYSSDDQNLSVYGNNSTPGNLSFPSPAAKTDLPLLVFNYPRNLVAADLDDDGMPDLACTNYGGSVSVFRNTGVPGGAVSFAAESNIAVNPGNFMSGLGAADLDGDGKIDLVSATTDVNDEVTGTLNLLYNTSSSGSISFSAPPTSIPTVNAPSYIMVNDLDGDGLPDVAVASQNDQSVGIHRNISTSGAISLSSHVSYVTGFIPSWLAAADLDGDGQPDLVVTDNGSSSVSIMRNRKPTDITITSFSPATASTGTVVTITGTNLSGATAVNFGGTPALAFTIVSPTTITATVGGGSSGGVMVSSPTSYDLSDGFTYTRVASTVTSFSPTTGSTGTVILIEGTGFIANQINAVSFGGTLAQAMTILSDTTISATVGAGSTGDVRVMSVADTASLNGFTFTSTAAGPPAITSFTPLSATQGTDITITGTNLSNITAVAFGGTQAQSYRVISDNIVHATVAGGATGSVTATGPAGTGSYPGFTFLSAPPPPAPPTITGFSPQSAKTGETVIIKGTYLSGVTAVTFGGTRAISISACLTLSSRP